jgi:hypothetical protein
MEMTKYTVPIGDSRTPTQFDIRDSESVNKISDLKAYIGYTDTDIAGIEVDYENNTFTRLAGAVGKNAGSDFNTFPVYGGMRRCNLADDGTVNAYYGDNNYIEDGTNGQVMVEIPKFWYKVVPLKLKKQDWEDYEAVTWTSKKYAVGDTVIYNNEYYTCTTANTDETFTPANWHKITELGLEGYHILKARYYISSVPKAGFKVHPLFVVNGEEIDRAYYSAYEGIAYDVSESKYLLDDEQVLNVTAGTGDKLSSIGGNYERTITYYDKATTSYKTADVNCGAKPISGLTSSNNLTRAGARNIAANRGAGWYQQTVKSVCAVWLLFIVEYGNCNIQNSIGAGVTGIADDSTSNMASYIGSTASLGNASGVATSTVDYSGTAQTASNKTSVGYRGIENFYGNIWKWVDGVNVYGAYNNGGGKVYICSDMSFADNKITDNYKFAGFTLAQKSGYIKYFGYGSEDYDWLFMVSKLGGNSNLPVGDNNYVTPSLNGHRVACLGASWYYGANAGLYWGCNGASSNRNRNISSRSLYLG